MVLVQVEVSHISHRRVDYVMSRVGHAKLSAMIRWPLSFSIFRDYPSMFASKADKYCAALSLQLPGTASQCCLPVALALHMPSISIKFCRNISITDPYYQASDIGRFNLHQALVCCCLRLGEP